LLFNVEIYAPSSGMVVKLQTIWKCSSYVEYCINMHKSSLLIRAVHDNSCIKQAFRHWSCLNDLDIYEEEMTFPGCKPSLKKIDISHQVYVFKQPEYVFKQTYPQVFKVKIPKVNVNQNNLLVSWNKQSEYCKNNKLEFPHKRALHLLRKKIQLPLNQTKFKNFIVKLVNLNSNKEKDKLFKKTVPFGDQLNLLQNGKYTSGQPIIDFSWNQNPVVSENRSSLVHENEFSSLTSSEQIKCEGTASHESAKYNQKKSFKDKQALSPDSDDNNVNKFGTFICKLLVLHFQKEYAKDLLEYYQKVFDKKISTANLKTQKDKQMYDKIIRKYNVVSEQLKDCSKFYFVKLS